MCLYSSNIKPLVAKKDLIVYKELVKGKGCILTPFQNMHVTLGRSIKPRGEMPELPSDYSENRVGEGVIHSYTNDIWGEYYDNAFFAKAIIKAGTPFFVSIDGNYAASRELYLTSQKESYEKETRNELNETRNAILELLREENVTDDGVHVGDVLLSDMSFTTPDEVTEESDAIGIVGFIRNNVPYVISLEQKKAKWFDGVKSKPANATENYLEAVNDFNGKKNTKTLRGKHKDNLEKYPALKYCLEYKTNGTKKGDWYFPSSGEMLQAVRNKFLIDSTAIILNSFGINAELLHHGEHFCTSKEYNDEKPWACNACIAYVQVWGYKMNSHYVRPMLDPAKYIKNQVK